MGIYSYSFSNLEKVIHLNLLENHLEAHIYHSQKNYLNIQPEIGMEVIATGKITSWSRYKRTYQIDIDNIEVEGDTFFPNWDKAEWEEVSRIDSKDPTQNIEYSFFQYSRISLRRP